MHITAKLYKRSEPFLRGMAAVIYFAGLRQPPGSRAGAESDHEALCSDWAAIGSDMRRAIRTYEREP
jgi:hypothetical protein